ncbi:hypothetical protein ABW20_dc0103204 [Dactylellina cionopaga]|nr:hypothetical protein ABW20_dc0103204 [Dactylellina cionopaga]
MPTAASRVLNIPELLSPILVHCGETMATPDRILHLEALWRLRAVSKLWCAIIDTSPELLAITFRNPRLRVGKEEWEICGAFQEYIASKMEVHAMLRGARGPFAQDGKQSRGYKDLSRFIDKALEPGGGFPADIFLTQPVFDRVALQLGVSGSKVWARQYGSYIQDNAADWNGSNLFIWNEAGVTGRMILEKLRELKEVWYSTPGDFTVHEIVLRFGAKVGYDDDSDKDYDGDSNCSDLFCEAEYILWPLRYEYETVETLDD